MNDILAQILDNKALEVARLKEDKSIRELESQISSGHKINLFKNNLVNKKPLALIAEVKFASPSKGIICQDKLPDTIAKQYEEGGADAISVLTDSKYFGGSIDYLRIVKQTVNLPILRKDFIIDEIQIVQTRAIGANAILLIVAVLGEAKTKNFIDLSKQYNLDALVEVHSEGELSIAIEAGAEIIGINNRDLTSFQVALDTTFNLLEKIPENIITISESGIKSVNDIRNLSEAGVDAVLIGEHLMLKSNRSKEIRELLSV